jgi:hypothetical protein
MFGIKMLDPAHVSGSKVIFLYLSAQILNSLFYFTENYNSTSQSLVIYVYFSRLGGVIVSVGYILLGPKFAGSNTAEAMDL